MPNTHIAHGSSRMKLLKTGIAGLDEFLRGGLPPKVFLLIGQPGSGSEVFAREVAYSRSRQSGVTYITVNRAPESIRDDMAAYRWDTLELEKEGRWRFVNPTKEDPLLTTVTGEMKLRRCTVIDSLSELLFTHKTEEAIDLLKAMSDQNRDGEEVHLVLLTEGMQEPRVDTALQHFAEGVIVFTTTWGTEVASRNIIIKKIPGTVTPTRSLPYTIRERGFTIETAIRIT